MPRGLGVRVPPPALVVREEIDSLSAVLKVVIERGDYEPKFNEELKKAKGQATLKGFRKGENPD